MFTLYLSPRLSTGFIALPILSIFLCLACGSKYEFQCKSRQQEIIQLAHHEHRDVRLTYPLWTEGSINQLLGILLVDNIQLSACIDQGSEKKNQ